MSGCVLRELGVEADWVAFSREWTKDALSMAVLALVFFLFFYSWNQMACAIFRANGFKNKKVVLELGSCSSSLIHCTVVSVLTYYELCSQGWGLFSSSEAFDLGSANTPTGIATMFFCISYMLADLVYLHRFSPGDKQYIVHHWATVVYMALCIWIGRGHLSTMLCIFLGEVTGPINNGMVISNLIVTETGVHTKAAGRANFFFASCLWTGFLLIRVLYAPWGVCWVLGSFYLGGGAGAGEIDILTRLVWVGLPLLVEYGSISFFFTLTADLRSGATSDVGKAALKKSK
uniref:TLC domain-containing protein n=1 Tax=Hemiselmis andersenii TaxID=464988 RepID=A0A7S1DGE5_HEMAN|mmetsp:Transcript_12453/g.30407  ORF Transcript_12453/g.30407 Transcript_12453/m.30407 type:complete len:289 (+) Transcript_12453:72-938(+)